MNHDGEPDDGYGSEQATISDEHYGDGLAWVPVVEDTRRFLENLQPDVVAFQEIFHPGDCAVIPPELHAGFVCETWIEGDSTVAETVVGMGYQVACHQGKDDKCVAVRRAFGTFRGCEGDLCLDFLDGARVPDCGSGSRVGRGVVELAGGGELTVVSVHGSSGIEAADVACRVAQFEQVFVGLDGEPAANGERNLILGDLNTDPGRYGEVDASAARFNDFVGEGEPFHFVTEVGRLAPRSYAGIVDIDHVVSDAFEGSCTIPGVTDDEPVSEITYFDHSPVVCEGRLAD
jgi:endonuclease/exonuclease/phosphatase family metal-dependent hydrolase